MVKRSLSHSSAYFVVLALLGKERQGVKREVGSTYTFSLVVLQQNLLLEALLTAAYGTGKASLLEVD